MKLFIFGSTGDLVKRKVIRALQELEKDKLGIYALGRRDIDKKEYQDFICSDWCGTKFRNSLNYINVNFDNLKICENLSEHETNYFYISLPPSEYKRVLKYLEKVVDKNYDIKILLEKPFGWDLESAKDLKNFIEKSNLKNKLFISDHYLFKKNFLNLPKEFRKVKIVSLEKVGLEGRVTYYDKIGALKDMIQSHFINLVLKNLNFEIEVSNANGRVKILDFIKGQYKGYLKELGFQSRTETFVYLKFECCGKEFEFITGKAFDKKESFVEIDGKKFTDAGDNSYVEIFRRFLSKDKKLMKDFPTMNDSVLSWKIVERFEDFGKSKELISYDKSSSLRDVLKEKNS